MKLGATASGVAFGLLSVLFWAVYNVGSDMGEGDGFRPVDLVFFRFVGGGVFLLPVLIASRRRLPPTAKVLALCALVGPLFGFLVATGFKYVPLAHAVVVPPATSIIVATLLVRFVKKEPLPLQRLIGIGILFAGLVLLAFEAPDAAQADGPVWLGDLSFVASGTLWGSYTFLMSHWKLPAAPTAAAVMVVSGAVFAPLYFSTFGLADLPPSLLAEQAFYQGMIGGGLSFLTFAATVSRLGAAHAALFFALTPPAAVLLAIPMMGSLPTGLQVASIVLATVGITVSLEISLTGRRVLPSG